MSTAPPESSPISAAGSKAVPPVPPALANVLRRAHAREREAAGPSRRRAFELTRLLLSAAHGAGYSSTQLARCLDLRASTVLTRFMRDGYITTAEFAALADVPEATIHNWAVTGRIDRAGPTRRPRDRYLASELVRALSGATWRSSR